MLRVMTFNLWADHPLSQSWKKREPGVKAVLEKFQPDLIGFQEAIQGRILSLAQSGPEYAWKGVGRDDGKEGGEFCPIFFRSEKLQLKFFETRWLSTTPGEPSRSWKAACHRLATFCQLEERATGQNFLAVNTHFDHWSPWAREESAALLRREIALREKGQPVVVLGDFNLGPKSPAYDRLVAGEEGLQDALRSCTGPCEGPTHTWRGWNGWHWGGRARFDYIFVRSCRVLRHVTIAEKVGGVYPSDHFPVYCDLELGR
jgi:endonuclease/exonuclease/phosphatase family metal-dependent hydrolase